jgi:phage-related protein
MNLALQSDSLKPTIQEHYLGNGVHELRLKDRFGVYRFFYVLLGAGVVYVLHAFQKKMQATPQSSIDLARKRLKELKL